MLELTADHDLRAGATTNLSLVPEFQVTVNTRSTYALRWVTRSHSTTRRLRPIRSSSTSCGIGGLLEGW